MATRPDLLDRAVVIYLPHIENSRRTLDRDFWSRFEAAGPGLLGVLLDALCGALKEEPAVKASTLPRMADSARWGPAVEKALGWPSGSFMRAHDANHEEVQMLPLEASLIPTLVKEDLPKLWSGTAAELLGLLERYLEQRKLPRSKNWPQTPWAVSSTLRRLKANLEKIGVFVDFERKGHGGKRLIRIEQVQAPSPGADGDGNSRREAAVTEATHGDTALF